MRAAMARQTCASGSSGGVARSIGGDPFSPVANQVRQHGILCHQLFEAPLREPLHRSEHIFGGEDLAQFRVVVSHPSRHRLKRSTLRRIQLFTVPIGIIKGGQSLLIPARDIADQLA
jgi:hypothetical protein